jgi:hypothetical protein
MLPAMTKHCRNCRTDPCRQCRCQCHPTGKPCGARLDNGARIPLEFVCERPTSHRGYHKQTIPGWGINGALFIRNWPQGE